MGWVMLLPEQAEVKKYFRHEKPDFDGDVRRLTLFWVKYTLIASKEMNGFPLACLEFPVPQGKSKKENIPFQLS
jgi:hypothetical protein